MYTVYPLESKHQLYCVMRRQWNDNECKKKSKFVLSDSRNVSWTLKKVVFLNKKKESQSRKKQITHLTGQYDVVFVLSHSFFQLRDFLINIIEE